MTTERFSQRADPYNVGNEGGLTLVPRLMGVI